jgi:hypothetical protein
VGAVTFVLVATMDGNNGPRAVGLLASMQRFLDPEYSAVHLLLVVVPGSEVAWWELAAAAWLDRGRSGARRAFRAVILSEDQVLTSAASFLKASAPSAAARELNGMGYRLQMLIKLGVAKHVPTEFYVTLDCDVVLAKPLAPGVLVQGAEAGGGGRGVMQGEMRGGNSERWMSNSLDMFFGGQVGAAAAGDTRNCTVARLLNTVGVTPAVLSAAAAAAVTAALGRVGAGAEQAWDHYLMAALDSGADWTEYGLYAAGTCLDGLLDQVHMIDPAIRLYDPVLQEDGSRVTNATVTSMAFDPRGRDVFVVLQSIGGSDAAKIAQVLHMHMKAVPKPLYEYPNP